MSRPNSTRLLDRARVEYRLHQLDDGIRSGEEMAAALGADPALVLRSLVVELERSSRSGAGPARRVRALCLVAADRSLDLARCARSTDSLRARVAETHEAERWTGAKRGAISPLGVPPGRFEVWIDGRVEGVERVFVSAGAFGAELELAAGDLARACDGRFVDLV